MKKATTTMCRRLAYRRMALVDTLIVLIVSFLIGALGIYLGARVVTDTDDYSYALITAVIGAIVWAVVALFLGWIPLLGPILALIAWIAVINWRYPGGWLDAAIIGVVAWIAAVIVLYVLALLNIFAFEALGIPGV